MLNHHPIFFQSYPATNVQQHSPQVQPVDTKEQNLKIKKGEENVKSYEIILKQKTLTEHSKSNHQSYFHFNSYKKEVPSTLAYKQIYQQTIEL